MNRLTITLGAVIAITAMFAIPNASTHFAKASICNSSAATHGSSSSDGNQGSGSCSIFAASSAALHHSTTGFSPSGGHHDTSSCSTVSISSKGTSAQNSGLSSSVSCSSHSP